MDYTPKHSWSLSLQSGSPLLSPPVPTSPKVATVSRRRRLLTDVVHKVLLPDGNGRGGFPILSKSALIGGGSLSPTFHGSFKRMNLRSSSEVNQQLLADMQWDIQHIKQIKLALKQLQFVLLVTTLSKHSSLQQQLTLMASQHNIMQRRLQEIEKETASLMSSVTRLCEQLHKADQGRHEISLTCQENLKLLQADFQSSVGNQYLHRVKEDADCGGHGHDLIRDSGFLLLALYLSEKRFVCTFVQRFAYCVSPPKHRKWVTRLVHLVLLWEMLIFFRALSYRLNPVNRLWHMMSGAITSAMAVPHWLRNLLVNQDTPATVCNKKLSNST